jgi:hypothetical protein
MTQKIGSTSETAVLLLLVKGMVFISCPTTPPSRLLEPSSRTLLYKEKTSRVHQPGKRKNRERETELDRKRNGRDLNSPPRKILTLEPLFSSLVFSTVISNGYNLLTLTPFPSAQPTDQFGVTAAAIGLGPLANNGGWTMTHSLLTGSLAINNGYDGLFLCLVGNPCSDQRGTGYPRKKSTAIDVGAFESSFTS